MDDVDRKLLRLLKGDARASFVDLAKVLGTSEGTVRARVKRLQEDGVIRRFTVQTAGSNVKALVEVRIETNIATGKLAGDIAGWDGVERVWEVAGEYDVVVIVDVESTAALNEIIDRIRQFPGTQSTRSRLILKES